MSQNDFSIANASGATVRADINTALQALATVSSGATAPSTTYAYQLWADTTAGLLKQRNAANSAWEVRGTLAETLIVARSSNTIIAAGDFGKTFVCTSTFTQTLTAAATLGDGFTCNFRNDGSGIITIDPNGTETIDGTQSIQLRPGDSCALWCDGSNWKTIGRAHSALPALLPGSIQGLTYANNGTDPTNDIDIAAGVAVSSDASDILALTSTLTKRLDAAWAVGSGNGGLDTGSIGNSDYYIHLIKRTDTGVVDALFSLSPTAPTMPSNYDKRRLIGWFKRVGGTIVAFHTYEVSGGGIQMAWDSPTLDINLANTLTTSRRTDAVKVPLNFSVVANLNVLIVDTSGFVAWVYCPDQADLAPSATGAPLSSLATEGTSPFSGSQFNISVRTSSAGLIAARANLATVDTYAVATLSFDWGRRNAL